MSRHQPLCPHCGHMLTPRPYRETGGVYDCEGCGRKIILGIEDPKSNTGRNKILLPDDKAFIRARQCRKTADRDIEIYERREAGEKYSSIAESYDQVKSSIMSAGKKYQYLKKNVESIDDEEQKGISELYGAIASLITGEHTRVRICNVLYDSGYGSLKKLKKAKWSELTKIHRIGLGLLSRMAEAGLIKDDRPKQPAKKNHRAKRKPTKLRTDPLRRKTDKEWRKEHKQK